MNEVIREFLLETHENLAQLDLDLVTLEKDPRERDTLARAFRTLHTVKGTAGFLGMEKLQAVAHAAEYLLSQLRDGVLVFNPPIASALLGVVDAIRRMLAALENSGSEGDADFGPLIQTLEQLRIPHAPGAATTELPAMPPSGNMAALSPTAQPPAGPTIFTPPSAVQPEPPPSPAAQPTPPSMVIAAVPAAGNVAQEPDKAEPRASTVSDSAIRVDVGLLDKLMTLVGELVLARNQIMQFSTSQEDAPFVATVQRLNLLTTELQANVMKTRMQPIQNIWSKFPRVVRDLAAACNKQVHLEMEGQETELDRTIIEAIRDPLTHLVRNAVDHGIELPAERLRRGKPAQGFLSLHASHEGGKVVIEISDDGAGIDPKRVRDKAIQAKLVTLEQAERMSERELVNLVFLPGFSTAEKITHFSGRGVGMDVVRTHVEKIGGTVSIQSQVGKGTTVQMKIPLTLAIIPALTITSGGDRYAIPQVNLLELVRLEKERGIEMIHGAPVYRLRGNLLPLVYLDRELKVGVPAANGSAGDRAGEGRPQEVHVVVLQADDRQFGLVVEAIHDTEEIVVKPLQKQLKGIGVFAGATIMGDGKVALILDVLGLAQRAHVISGVRERSLSEKTAAPAEQEADRLTVLLFAAADGGRMAIPLTEVARLEEFPRSALERVGSQHVVQYRNEIMPLLHVSRALGRKSRRRSPWRKERAAGTKAMASDPVQVVVYAGKTQRVGLVVGRILDIVEEAVVSRAAATRPGVLFTAVIQGKVTEFIDVEGMLRFADSHYFAEEPVAAAKA